MKNKKITYLLGLVVIVVWGLIIYRIVDTVSNNDDALPSSPIKIAKEPYDDDSVPKDTTHLLLNYRDPFGLVKQKDTVKSTLNLHPKRVVTIPKLAFNWAFIKYSGYVRNPGSKQLIAILTVNGKQVEMKEGDVIDKVKLIRNMHDSVKVSFEGKTKFIAMHRGDI